MIMSARPCQLLTVTVAQKLAPECNSFAPTLRASCDKSCGQSNFFALRLETVPQVSEELNQIHALKAKTIFSEANLMRPSLNVHHTALQNPTIQPHKRLGAYEVGQLRLLS